MTGHKVAYIHHSWSCNNSGVRHEIMVKKVTSQNILFAIVDEAAILYVQTKTTKTGHFISILVVKATRENGNTEIRMC